MSPPIHLTFWRAIRSLIDHDGIELAGYIAYTILVALFPFLVFLFALAGFVGQGELAEIFVDYTFEMVPEQITETLFPIVQEVLLTKRPQLMTFSIIITLWIASSGVEAIRLGINRAYAVEERRNIVIRRLLSLGFVIGAAITVLAACFLIIALPVVLKIMGEYTMIPFQTLLQITLLRYVLAFFLLIGFLGVLYRQLPNVHHSWRHVLPGAVLCALLWIIMASLFSIYLVNFATYAVTYGSLGGIIITLLFLHASSVLFLYGAEVNAILGRENNVF